MSSTPSTPTHIWIRESIWDRRHSWECRPVIGETTRSWILGPEWQSTKVPKRGYHSRLVAFSEADAAEQTWVDVNVHHISKAVSNVIDPVILRQIAALVNYVEESK